MDSHFQLPNKVSLPKDVKDIESNYYLTKVKNKSGGHVWELRKRSMPMFLKTIFMAISNYLSAQPIYVYENKLTAIMDIAANPAEKHLAKEHIEIFMASELEALSRSSDFQLMSRAVPGVETPKTKVQRAVRKAALIGKGMAQMEKQGIQGKTLSPSYMIEASSKEHFYEVDEYKEEWRKNETHLTFDDWMKWNHPDAEVQKVKYLANDRERLPYKLDFKDGIALRNNTPFNTASETTEHSGQGFAIFVIDSKGEFYAGSHVRGKFHHSSFLGGAAIMGAGEIQTNAEGKIIALSSKSGHYKPSKEQILNTLSLLEKAGIDLSQVKFTELTAEGSLIYNSAKEYLDTMGKCPFNGYEAFGIQSSPEGDYTITLNDKSLSKYDQLEQLASAIQFLKSKYHVASLIYKETLPNGQSVEYPMEAYLAGKGKTLPKKWEGGTLEFEGDKLKKIIIDSRLSADKNQHFFFLDLLARKGVDLSMIEMIIDEKTINGQEYFKLLEADYKATFF